MSESSLPSRKCGFKRRGSPAPEADCAGRADMGCPKLAGAGTGWQTTYAKMWTSCADDGQRLVSDILGPRWNGCLPCKRGLASVPIRLGGRTPGTVILRLSPHQRLANRFACILDSLCKGSVMALAKRKRIGKKTIPSKQVRKVASGRKRRKSDGTQPSKKVFPESTTATS
jgi:hypothetical protein